MLKNCSWFKPKKITKTSCIYEWTVTFSVNKPIAGLLKTYSKCRVSIALFCAGVVCSRSIRHVLYLNSSSVVLPKNYMQQRPSWESNRPSHFQENIGFNKLKFHYNVSLVLIEIHNLQPYLLKIYFNITFYIWSVHWSCLPDETEIFEVVKYILTFSAV
jgi:hypothetical protein